MVLMAINLITFLFLAIMASSQKKQMHRSLGKLIDSVAYLLYIFIFQVVGNLALNCYVYIQYYWNHKSETGVLFQIQSFAVPFFFIMIPCFLVMHKQYTVFKKTAANIPKPDKDRLDSSVS